VIEEKELFTPQVKAHTGFEELDIFSSRVSGSSKKEKRRSSSNTQIVGLKQKVQAKYCDDPPGIMKDYHPKDRRNANRTKSFRLGISGVQDSSEP